MTIVTRPTTAQDPNHPTTGDCASCHSSTTSFMAGITTKPPNHIPTTQACALCHTTPGNYAVATMNHTGITSGCATCHATGLTFANIVPVSPPPTHIPSGATACETCHAPAKFSNFSGTAMNHAGITTGCATCHATGKSFFGVTVVTPPPTHIPSGATACETCHAPAKFSNFSGTAMNHAGITTGCATCHATGKNFYGVTIVTPPATHIPVGAATCESCHAPAQFTNFSSTPMNHAPVSATACATCHETGKSWYGVTIVTRPTTAQDPNHPTTGDCASCHSSTTSFMAGITTKPPNHIPTTQACALCHTTPGNYSVATMNHTGITSGCATCHATGLTFANIVPVSPPPTHIPSGATACETCHAAGEVHQLRRHRDESRRNHDWLRDLSCHRQVVLRGDGGDAAGDPHPGRRCRLRDAATPRRKFTNFGGTPMNHAPVSGTTCATCHETGKSWYGVTIVTRPTAAQDPNHPTTGDCASCHSSTTSFMAGITTKPPNHIPTTQACALCHTTPGNYAVATMNHTGITYRLCDLPCDWLDASPTWCRYRRRRPTSRVAPPRARPATRRRSSAISAAPR